jgi:hypothetical protein
VREDSLGAGAAGRKDVDGAPVAGIRRTGEGEDVVGGRAEGLVEAHEDAASGDDQGGPGEIEETREE